MATRAIDPDFAIEPLKQGRFTSDDGETGCQYAVFARDLAEASYGPLLGACLENVAFELTGWAPFYKGPGRAFAHEPRVRVYRHKVLVYQRSGLDV